MPPKLAPPVPCVYAITCMPTRQSYVGGTFNIKIRWRAHRWQLRRGVSQHAELQAAWIEYGEAAFVLEILEEVPASAGRTALQQAEVRWLQTLRPAFNRRLDYPYVMTRQLGT